MQDAESARSGDDMASSTQTERVGAIPIEEVAKHPYPGTAIPGSLHFTPDGHKLIFLGARTGVTVWDGTSLPDSAFRTG